MSRRTDRRSATIEGSSATPHLRARFRATGTFLSPPLHHYLSIGRRIARKVQVLVRQPRHEPGSELATRHCLIGFLSGAVVLTDMSSSPERREFLRAVVSAVATAPILGWMLSLTACGTKPTRMAYHRHSAEQAGPTRSLHIAAEVAEVEIAPGHSYRTWV